MNQFFASFAQRFHLLECRVQFLPGDFQCVLPLDDLLSQLGLFGNDMLDTTPQMFIPRPFTAESLANLGEGAVGLVVAGLALVTRYLRFPQLAAAKLQSGSLLVYGH